MADVKTSCRCSMSTNDTSPILLPLRCTIGVEVEVEVEVDSSGVPLTFRFLR